MNDKSTRYLQRASNRYSIMLSRTLIKSVPHVHAESIERVDPHTTRALS